MKKTGENRTTWQIIRTGIDGTTTVHSIISGTSTPYLSEISGNSDAPPYGISGTSAAPPSGGLWIPIIGNIRQSTSPNVRNTNELNAEADRKLSNNPIVLSVSTRVFGEKLSDISIRDLYTRCRMNLPT